MGKKGQVLLDVGLYFPECVKYMILLNFYETRIKYTLFSVFFGRIGGVFSLFWPLLWGRANTGKVLYLRCVFRAILDTHSDLS